MPLENLTQLTEREIADLLGVSRRMVRKYMREKGLPCVGNGRLRRFDWLTTLEWYLLYRVEIVSSGGNQRTTIARNIQKIRNDASSAAWAECSVRHQKNAASERLRYERQLHELKASGGDRWQVE